MKTIQRHPKKLQQKSKRHVVKQLSPAHFEVRSGASGKVYYVRLFADGSATCTCDWAKYRPASTGKRSGCSHTLAALNFKAQQEGRRISAWASEEDARRQKKPALNIGDGLVITLRKEAA